MHRSAILLLVTLLIAGQANSQQSIDPSENAKRAEPPGLSTSSPYSLDPDWPRLPPGIPLGQVTGVGVDSRNHVHVFHRADRTWTTPFPKDNIQTPTILVFDGETGQFIRAYGERQFIMPHGLSIGPDDNVWVTDVGSHQIHQLSREDGAILLSLGERGVQGNDQDHFALPTDVAITREGNVYVSDGYANTRVVTLNPAGGFEFQWGTPGAQPGAFDLPHGIAVTEDRIYVADRSNLRVQVFDHQGVFITEWKGGHIGRPFGVATRGKGEIVVIDGGDQPNHTRSRVVVLNEQGGVLHMFSATMASDQRNLGHDLAVSQDGSIYVADAWANCIRKFVRSD